MLSRRPLALCAVLVGLLAVVTAGCGSSSVAAPELTSFASVAQRSSAADSARFAVTFGLTLPGVDEELSFEADGGFDNAARRSQLTVDLSSVAELMKGLGSAFGGTTSGDLGDPDDWKLDAIQDADTVYIRFPLLADQLPQGKTWIKGDANDLERAGGDQLGQFGSLAGTDPRDIFGLLKAVSGSIEAVGSDEIRGVETNHYRATIDLAKVSGLVPDAKRQGLGNLDEMAKQSGLTVLPLDIWIDADQRVRKLAIDLEAKPSDDGAAAGFPFGAGGSLEASLVVELYDYGVPLDLELPAADQVADAATLKPASLPLPS